MPSRFSLFWHNPKFWDCVSRTLKISEGSIILTPKPQSCYAKTLDNFIPVRIQNMGGKLRKLRSLQPKQWSCAKTNLAHICTTSKTARIFFFITFTPNIIAFLHDGYTYLCGRKKLDAKSKRNTLGTRNCVIMHWS